MFASPAQSPPANPVATTMSKSEVEQLLASVSESDALAGGPGGDPGAGQDAVSRHDFPQVSSFTAGEMRNLRLRCESFVSSLAARLSIRLRLECSLQMTRLDTLRYQPFVDALSNPTYLTLFKIEPLEGVCLLDMPAKLGLTLVDRELGGPAVCQDEVRDLTEMEAKLAAKVVNLMVGEWCSVWADALPIRPVLLRHETTGRFLNLASPETLFLTLGLEVRMAQTVETIHIAFPLAILQSLLAKLNSDLQPGQKPPAPQTAAGPRWNPALDDVRVQVSARWRGLAISARQLAALKPGDLLPLCPAATSQVEISLEALPKFTGQLGTAGKQLAVKIVETLKT